MHTASLSWSLFSGLLLAASLAHAQSEGDCYGFEISDREPAGMARVLSGQPRTWFIKGASEGEDCPSPTASCRRKAFLVPGDLVVTTHEHIVLACATFVGKGGRLTTGWLPTEALEKAEVKAIAPADWAGEWTRDAEASISIKTLGRDRLEISGDATWGASDPGRVARGGVNIGQIGATTIRVDKPLITFVAELGNAPPALVDESSCVVTVQRISELLLVRDNQQCGGHNVSFSGIYRR